MRSTHLSCFRWILVVLFAAMSCPAMQPTAAVESADRAWPNWMGAHHDGISRERDWSSDWPESGLPIMWQKQIGIGFSSLAIADGCLFTMGHKDGKETVYCLDNATGEILWTHSYSAALVDNLHEGGPGSTPTIDGEYVYTLGREGQLYCFRAADGEIIWSKLLQQDLGIELPEWGFTSSAYILDNQLILEAGRVVSYDKASGKKNWQTAMHMAGYGTARSFLHNGRPHLATLDCDGVRVLHANDGSLVAFAEWDSPFRTNSTTPIIHKDKLYISTGYNIGCGLFQLQEDTLQLVYHNREMRNHFNNSILYEGHLYGFDGNSNLGRVVHLKCMKLEDGSVAWKKRGFGCGSLMIADNKLLILSDDGTLALAQATPDGYQELARSKFLDGRCWTMPVLFSRHVYGRNAAGKLVCAQLPLAE